MMKEVLSRLETGALAEIGLLAFLFAFVLIVVRVMLMNRTDRQQAKRLPLDDPREVAHPSNHA